MKLVSFSVGCLKNRVGLYVNERIYDVNAYVEKKLACSGEPFASQMADLLVPPTMREFLIAGERAMNAARELEANLSACCLSVDAPSWPRPEVRLETPINNPSKIICLSHNYKDFIRETGVPTPPVPRIFSKYNNSLCGPEDPIIYPYETKELGYEAELAFIVGKPARRVSEEDALSYIAGYTILNDVSASDLTTLDIQVLRGKTFDNFAPTGPWIVTSDEIGDPGNLDLGCWVNGVQLQKSNTRELLYDVPCLVSFLSRIFTLEPGDIVATGTPGGLAKFRKPGTYMNPGDVCTIKIEKIGVLENRIVHESEMGKGSKRCC